MNVRALLLCLLVGCASNPPPVAPAAAPASAGSAPATSAVSAPTTSAPAASSAPRAASAAAPPSPGYVFVGEIAGTPKFDPKPTLEGMKPQLLECYGKARATTPTLRGKLTLHIAVNEAGAVLHVEGQGPAADPAFVTCIGEALKAGGPFPRPGGSAVVTAPLVFRP
jgi:hypothetical protein